MKKIAEERTTIENNLATFDTLDYTVFSNQEWTRLHESHAEDIAVYWPDGRMTLGIEMHIDDLKAMFVFAPDTRVKVHPIRFGSGKFTAVTGIFEGTFTKPMPAGNGKFIQQPGGAMVSRAVDIVASTTSRAAILRRSTPLRAPVFKQISYGPCLGYPYLKVT